MIDDVDIKIMSILQQNGRTKRNVLAEKVGLSLATVSDRMKKLEDAGIISGYHAELDPKKLWKDITAFILVYIDSSKHYYDFIGHIHNLDEIQECHAITGEGSHLLKIRTHNTATLEKLLTKVQSFPGVISTKTSIVLSSSKETNQIKITPPKER